MLRQIKNYTKHSGVTITLVLNPMHWLLKPRATRIPKYADEQIMYGENFRGMLVEFLFVKVEMFIDNGYLEDWF